MLITKITKNRKERNSYSIYIDEALAFHVSDEVFVKFGLGLGKRLDEKTVELIASAEAFERAKKIALHFLSYRPRSSKEVVRKLQTQGYSTDLAKQVVHHLHSLDLIDDLQYARMFVRDKLRGRPMGKAMMRRKLMERGISFHMIEQVLKEYISEEDEQEAAAKLAAKKLQVQRERFAKLDLAKKQKRLLDYLLNRGFSSEVAAKTVRSLIT